MNKQIKAILASYPADIRIIRPRVGSKKNITTYEVKLRRTITDSEFTNLYRQLNQAVQHPDKLKLVMKTGLSEAVDSNKANK